MRNRWTAFLTACAAAVMFTAMPVDAAPKNKAPKTTASHSQGRGQTTHGPKATTGTTPHGPKAKTTTTTTSSGRGAKAKADARTTKKSNTTSTSTSGTNTTNTTWTPDPDNDVAVKLSTKSNLMNKVRTILGANTDLNAATAGFRNFGQFMAAVNVSNNLGIPFADLKAAMTGTTLAGTSTGQAPVSLGQAIQRLKPGTNAETEAARAQSQADRDTRGR